MYGYFPQENSYVNLFKLTPLDKKLEIGIPKIEYDKKFSSNISFGNTILSSLTDKDTTRKDLIEFFKKEYNACDLPEEAERIHEEVHQTVCGLVGRAFEKREVFQADTKCIGESFTFLPLILINPKCANQDSTYNGYKEFLRSNPGMTTSDFLRSYLVHEYMHQYVQERDVLIKSILDDNGFKKDIAYYSISEGFAYFAQEEIGNVDILNMDLLYGYVKLNSDIFGSFYSLLKQESEKKGFEFVFRNFFEILSENIGKLNEVELHPKLRYDLVNDKLNISFELIYLDYHECKHNLYS